MVIRLCCYMAGIWIPKCGTTSSPSLPETSVGADDHFHLHRIAETLEEKINGAKRVLIPETHHMPNMEKPDEFNQIVLDFLKSL